MANKLGRFEAMTGNETSALLLEATPSSAQKSEGRATPTQHFITLDGYRGIAAIFVAVLHLCQQTGVLYAGHAEMAVDFFFILSGFVIALSYEGRLFSGTLSLWGFVRLRWIRLYPMMFAGAVLGIISRLVEGRFSTQAIMAAGFFAMLLLPLPRIHGDGDSYPINGPEWSLTHEFLVNFLFAMFVRFLRGKGLVMTLLFALGVEFWLAFHANGLIAAVGWTDQWKAALRALAPFLLGVTLFHHRGRAPGRHGDIWPLIGSLGLIAALVCWFTSTYYSLLCIYLLFPILIWTGTCQPNSPWLRKAMIWLGEISYPLYAVNEPVSKFLKITNRGVLATILAAHPVALRLVFGIVGLGLAWLLAHWFDEPVRNWLRTRLRPAKTTKL